MLSITYTLLTDGSSDHCLTHHIKWILDQRNVSFRAQIAFRALPHKKGLLKRVEAALEFYPCDVLFLHRDAENDSYNSRLEEIRRSLDGRIDTPVIPIIPMKMTEAWLLHDEEAIKKAAENPNSRVDLNLPRLRDIENISDPKNILFEKLKLATGLTGHRLTKYNPHQSRHRVAELISSYGALQAVSSFQFLEREIDTFLQSRGNE